MGGRLAVLVCGDDPITGAGVAAQMRGRPEVFVSDTIGSCRIDVVVAVVERLGDQAGGLLRRLRRDGHERIVVVCAHIDDEALMRARELGVGRVVRRCDATPERLSAAVVAAAHDGTRVAPDHFGRLLDQVNRTEQRPVDPHAFSAREVDVLRLLAEGYDTADIADALAYSERTIKNVIHAVTSRLQLRNRSHAVAVAMRTGVI